MDAEVRNPKSRADLGSAARPACTKINLKDNGMTLQDQLADLLPASRVHTRLIDRVAYANDASYFRLVPQAVVQPAAIGEIQALFEFTQKNRIPMTFRAAGTSLSGQAVSDGILVDISKHWGRYSVEDGGKLIRTQPGIVGGLLNNVLKPYGRRIGPDPASIDACMMGGILANNSSGMCCGVTENAYRTLHSMTFVLPNGLVINTADADAAAQLHEGAPEIESGVLELKRRILAAKFTEKDEGHPGGQRDKSLADRIRRRYRQKNNNGYLLNAFLDFEAPLDILTHLLIGSEGTLGFIAEAVLNTLPDYPRRYTGQLYFKTLQDAADAIGPLAGSAARAAEIMDRPSLRSVEALTGSPALLAGLPETAAAILVEYQGQSAEDISGFRRAAENLLPNLTLLHDPEFTEDPAHQASLWKLRKGIIPSVGAKRQPATTLLCEDVVFPVASLADGITDLQHLFADHGYAEGVVFGHAKDGNLHFLLSQSFDTDADVSRFAAFMDDLVRVVSDKYDGALKAEHGTGRNTAPFVAAEWGQEAYAIMRDLKALIDPDCMLNPGVVINEDPRAHVTHVKTMARVAPEVDKCIECGFCESKCPSRRLTLTPRQRIVVQREISRLEQLPHSHRDSEKIGQLREAESLRQDYLYAGMDTCAADGMCATACPVGINTGDFIKGLRAASTRHKRNARWVAEHFRLAEKAIGWSVRAGHAAERLIGSAGVKSISSMAGRITHTTPPKWNESIPHPTKNLRALRVLRGEKDFIYFPSCISRQLGKPANGAHLSLSETLLTLTDRANLDLIIPPDVAGNCCGMPFASKGYVEAYHMTLHKTLHRFWEWSEAGSHPIVIDTTSCTHTLRTCGDDLSPDDRGLWQKLTILDSLEFLQDEVLPRLSIQPLDQDVVLHPNCSARKLGLDATMLAIAERCARSAAVPLNLGCCAFAGDRGLLFPELTASATEKEAAEVTAHDYGGYYSSNIPCEIGMSEATGKDYLSIVYLVEEVSQ
jgi:D-lactate dehydrogenase